MDLEQKLQRKRGTLSKTSYLYFLNRNNILFRNFIFEENLIEQVSKCEISLGGPSMKGRLSNVSRPNTRYACR